MLGFAVSEAHRSQELMLKLKGQKATGMNVVPGKALGARESIADIAQKRTRRRRRTKKPNVDGVPLHAGPRPVGSSGLPVRTGPSALPMRTGPSGVPMRTGPRPGPSTSRLVAAAANAHRNGMKQHDAPMKKRDLYFSLRCGMVSTGTMGEKVAAGRVTVVNWDNQVVLDTFIKVPPEEVYNYRTEETGITCELLAMTSALQFKVARAKVGSLIRGKILIGHGLEFDLAALGLTHPGSDTRDLTTYKPYMTRVSNGRSTMIVPRQLEDLTQLVFGRHLNRDQPTLLREAVGAMELYRHARAEWEKELVLAMRQKKQQREMIMNMRLNGGPQLSAIKEDDVLVAGVRHNQFDFEDSTFTTAPSTNESIDDSSDATSFVTEVTKDTNYGDTESCYGMRRGDSDYGLAHIDSMSDLSSAYDVEEQEEMYNTMAMNPGIWSPSPQAGPGSWISDSSSHSDFTSEGPDDFADNDTISYMTEEGLLPTHLLADIEEHESRYVGNAEESYQSEGSEGSHQDCQKPKEETPDTPDTPLSRSSQEAERLSAPEVSTENRPTPGRAVASNAGSEEETSLDYEYDYGTHGAQDDKVYDCGDDNEGKKERMQGSSEESESGATEGLRTRRTKSEDLELPQGSSKADATPVPEEKKKGWFGLGRRRASITGASSQNNDASPREEHVKAEALSNSDRSQSKNLVSNEPWLEGEVGTPKFSMFVRKTAAVQSPATKPRSVRPPPGFSSA